MGEVQAKYAADISLDSVQVSLWLEDGTTARLSFPKPPPGTDPVDAVKALLDLKRASNDWLAVDSLDIKSGGEMFVFVDHITAVMVI